MLKIYNTLTKQKEIFSPVHSGKVGMYSCGPTVYDYVHIGNIKSYIMADIVRRYLEYLGFEVRMIKNITDVGHLTADDIAQADSGEDKIIKKALMEKKTPTEIANFYQKYFEKTEREMNILPAHYFPKATAHIPQMIKLIQKLIEKKHAYEKNGNVFFDITSFPNYGKLSGNVLKNLKIGARLEKHPDKKNPWDFALWLKVSENHLLKYTSPWSIGCPGWHIECSAMSMEYLGDTLDIHTGGEDNIFPHHEAEIAQTESITGKLFVKYWIHGRHLMVDGQRMGKSKNNFYKLEDIKAKGFSPMDLRLFLLSGHHRSQINFTWEALKQAHSNLEKINNFIFYLHHNIQFENKSSELNIDIENYQKLFEKAMDDDFNTPAALSVVYNLINEINQKTRNNKIDSNEAKKLILFWKKINRVLGLVLTNKIEIPEEIKKIAEERKTARQEKNFQKSDELRSKIATLGYLIEDLENNEYYIKPK